MEQEFHLEAAFCRWYLQMGMWPVSKTSPVSGWKVRPPLPQQSHTHPGKEVTAQEQQQPPCPALPYRCMTPSCPQQQCRSRTCCRNRHRAVDKAEVVNEKGKDVLLVPLMCAWKSAGWHVSPGRKWHKSIQSLLPSTESSTRG